MKIKDYQQRVLQTEKAVGLGVEGRELARVSMSFKAGLVFQC